MGERGKNIGRIATVVAAGGVSLAAMGVTTGTADAAPLNAPNKLGGWTDCKPGTVAKCPESLTILAKKRTDFSPGGVTYLELSRDGTTIPTDFDAQLPANEYKSKRFQAGDIDCIVKGKVNEAGVVFAQENCTPVGE